MSGRRRALRTHAWCKGAVWAAWGLGRPVEVGMAPPSAYLALEPHRGGVLLRDHGCVDVRTRPGEARRWQGPR